jgi:hypothetical protein
MMTAVSSDTAAISPNRGNPQQNADAAKYEPNDKQGAAMGRSHFWTAIVVTRFWSRAVVATSLYAFSSFAMLGDDR